MAPTSFNAEDLLAVSLFFRDGLHMLGFSRWDPRRL